MNDTASAPAHHRSAAPRRKPTQASASASVWRPNAGTSVMNVGARGPQSGHRPTDSAISRPSRRDRPMARAAGTIDTRPPTPMSDTRARRSGHVVARERRDRAGHEQLADERHRHPVVEVPVPRVAPREQGPEVRPVVAAGDAQRAVVARYEQRQQRREARDQRDDDGVPRHVDGAPPPLPRVHRRKDTQVVPGLSDLLRHQPATWRVSRGANRLCNRPCILGRLLRPIPMVRRAGR